MAISRVFLVSFVVLVFILISVRLSTAQRSRGNLRGRAQQFQQTLKTRLALTEQQSADIKKIFAAKRGTCKGYSDQAAKRECRRKLRQEINSEIQALLSAEQQQAFEGLKDEFRGERSNHRRRAL